MKKMTVALLMAMFPYYANAESFTADIYLINNGEESPTKNFQFDTANGFFDQLKDKGFQQAFGSAYTKNSIVIADTLYQGVNIHVTVGAEGQAANGQTEMIMTIDDLGVTEIFNGTSRSNVTKKMENYFRNDDKGTYSRLLEYQVANTPNSQIAGNPTSLQGQLVSTTFDYATNVPTTPTTPTTSAGDTGGSSANPLMVGVGGGTYTQGNLDISVINVPISKAFNAPFTEDPRKKLLVNGQFNYITVGQAASYQGSLGLGYMHPLTDNWYLIPSVSYGVIGSQDLASLGQIFSASISSNYKFKLADYDMAFVNMFGYYKTLPLSIDGVVSSDPNINNYVFKNGIFPSRVVSMFGHDVRVKGIFTDTEFTGSRVFVRQYNEVGIELSSVKKVEWLDKVTFGLADSLSLSGKYVFSIENPDGFEGYDIGISYDF